MMTLKRNSQSQHFRKNRIRAKRYLLKFQYKSKMNFKSNRIVVYKHKNLFKVPHLKRILPILMNKILKRINNLKKEIRLIC